MRASSVFFVVACLGTTSACTGDTLEEVPPIDTGAPDDPPAPDLKFVRQLRVNAFVAWDNVAKTIIDPQIDGESGFASALVLELSTEDGLDAEPEDRCRVVLELAGFSAAAPAQTRQWGLNILPGFQGQGPQFPQGTKPAATNCPERGFSDEQYPESAGALEYWASLPWRLAILGETLDPKLVDALNPDDDPGFDPGWFLQGKLEGTEPYGAPDDSPFAPLSFWEAFEMTDGNVTTEQDQFVGRLTSADIAAVPPGEVPTGYYIYDDFLFVELPDKLVYDPATGL